MAPIRSTRESHPQPFLAGRGVDTPADRINVFFIALQYLNSSIF
jgi:hypothetical protein